MRVPPDQSATLAEQAASASSGSFCLERARHIGEPRAEQEGVHALARIGDRMQEMQEQPGVLAHRAGNIEQRHDRRRLAAGTEIFEVDHRAAGLEARAQGAAQIDQMAMTMRRQPPRLDLVERAAPAA